MTIQPNPQSRYYTGNLKYNQQFSSVNDSSTSEADDTVPLASLYRNRLTAPSARHETGILTQLREDQCPVKARQSPTQFIEKQFANGNLRTANVVKDIRDTCAQWNTQYVKAKSHKTTEASIPPTVSIQSSDGSYAKEPQSAEEAADRYLHRVEPLGVSREAVLEYFCATYPNRANRTTKPMQSSPQDVPVSGNTTPVMRHRAIERSQSMSNVSKRTPVLPEATPVPPLPERQRPSVLKRWFSSVSLGKRHRRGNNVSAS
ncbi:hypothetical protein [Mycetohabitans sp. B46]|uniref:hypothetical protein n=1 Tax=Mycetohabitans sp. B46 TaxID=2772536 RepID=UPI00307DB31B